MRSPLTWTAVFLAIAAVLAHWLSPYRAQPQASTVDANPNRRRGFPELVAPADIDAELPLAVLISNSQAAATGIAPTQLYSAELRRRARERGVNLENWSSDGMRLAEAQLLAAQAQKRHAKWAIFVLGFMNVDPLDRVTLDYVNSDIDLLAGDPGFWSSLAGGPLRENLVIEGVVERVPSRFIELVRLRRAFVDAAAARLGAHLHPLAFGRVITGDEVPMFEAAPAAARPRRLPGKRRAPARESIQAHAHTDVRPLLETLERFAAAPLADLSASGTQVVWVWMPASKRRAGERLTSKAMAFSEAATPVLAGHGIAVHDRIDAVSDELFYDATHFLPAGHDAMADVMWSIVEPLFGGEGG